MLPIHDRGNRLCRVVSFRIRLSKSALGDNVLLAPVAQMEGRTEASMIRSRLSSSPGEAVGRSPIGNAMPRSIALNTASWSLKRSFVPFPIASRQFLIVSVM